MDCKLCRENIKAFLKSHLGEQDMQAFSHHLTTCPACKREVEQVAKMNQLFDDWQAPEPSLRFEVKLKSRIEKETVPWWKNIGLPWNWQVVAVSATVILVLAINVALFQLKGGSSPEEQYMQDMAIIEELDMLRNYEIIKHLEMFEHWEELEIMENQAEG